MMNFKQNLLACLAVMIYFMILFPEDVYAGGVRTDEVPLKTCMMRVHEHYEVNFIYDSSLDLNLSVDDYEAAAIDEAGKSLEECLDMLFDDTGISYEINRKYIVLTDRNSRKVKDYTIFIEERRDTITESVITALVDSERNMTQTGLKRIDSHDINSGFALFSTPDVIKTLQMQPGVASGTELLSGLYVHGGDGSDNLYLLDGVPLYQVSHLLGLFSSFNCDVMESMDFYKSGFPSRFGSKLSSVVDVTTRDGDFNDYHGTFGIGLIDGRFQFEGPLSKGRTSFNVGLRRTWTETLTVPLFAILNAVNKPGRTNAGYAFTDLNAKITHKFSEDNTLSANFYTGRDKFRFYNDESSSNGRKTEDTSLRWGNVTGSLNWNNRLNEAVSMRSTAYYTGSLSDIGFEYISYSKPDSPDMSVSGDGIYVGADVHDIGLKHDVFHLVGEKHKLRYGATAQYHIYSPSSTAVVDDDWDGIFQEGEIYADSLRYGAVETALYAEDEMALTEHFTMSAGLRYGVFVQGGRFWHSLEPRLAMKYSFGERLDARLSYTEMSQPAHLISSIYLDLPTNAWLPSTADIRPSRSREVAAGVYMNLSHYLHLNVEGWYKRMYNLLEYAGVVSFYPPLDGWESCYESGRGRSWGTELDFGYDNGRTEFNMYYTLSWNQRKFEELYWDWFRDRNDNRHKLTLMARHKFGKRFEIYGAWNWRSGDRRTMATHCSDGMYNVYLEPNNVKLPDYHRLDVGMNFIRNTRRGNVGVWNLSIYNAYCRFNPLIAYGQRFVLDGKVQAYYGVSYGMIPIVPTFSYTLKF